jgi:hypothetical protein
VKSSEGLQAVASSTSGPAKTMHRRATVVRKGRIRVRRALVRRRASSTPFRVRRSTRSGTKMDERMPPIKSS